MAAHPEPDAMTPEVDTSTPKPHLFKQVALHASTCSSEEGLEDLEGIHFVHVEPTSAAEAAAHTPIRSVAVSVVMGPLVGVREDLVSRSYLLELDARCFLITGVLVRVVHDRQPTVCFLGDTIEE